MTTVLTKMMMKTTMMIMRCTTARELCARQCCEEDVKGILKTKSLVYPGSSSFNLFPNKIPATMISVYPFPAH